ncbi:hypothetical protein V8F33_013934 [Rhypophila sp. PSN 637]
MCFHHYARCIICYGAENNHHWVEQCPKYRDQLSEMDPEKRAKYPEFCQRAIPLLPHNRHIERPKGNYAIFKSSPTPPDRQATHPETPRFMGSMSEIQPAAKLEPQEEEEEADLTHEQWQRNDLPDHSYTNQKSEQPDLYTNQQFDTDDFPGYSYTNQQSEQPEHPMTGSLDLPREPIADYSGQDEEQKFEQSSAHTNTYPLPAQELYFQDNQGSEWFLDTPSG